MFHVIFDCLNSLDGISVIQSRLSYLHVSYAYCVTCICRTRDSSDKFTIVSALLHYYLRLSRGKFRVRENVTCCVARGTFVHARTIAVNFLAGLSVSHPPNAGLRLGSIKSARYQNRSWRTRHPFTVRTGILHHNGLWVRRAALCARVSSHVLLRECVRVCVYVCARARSYYRHVTIAYGRRSQ